jgi:hypothetical protein
MLLYPFEGESLIEESGVRLSMPLDLLRREEPKCPKPILDLDGYELIVVRIYQRTWIVCRSKQPISTTIW